MTNSGNPAEMSPEERLKEVATILARGYLRLKKRNACLASASVESLEEPDVQGSEPPSLPCEESSPRGEKRLDSSANRSNHSQHVNATRE
jgi:hypothetical protein